MDFTWILMDFSEIFDGFGHAFYTDVRRHVVRLFIYSRMCLPAPTSFCKCPLLSNVSPNLAGNPLGAMVSPRSIPEMHVPLKDSI